MSDAHLPAHISPSNRLLTTAEFHKLAEVPPEIEWFANLGNARQRWVIALDQRADIRRRGGLW